MIPSHAFQWTLEEDDARGLLAIVLGQVVVVIAMFSGGSKYLGTRLRLAAPVGFVITPAFAATKVIQTNLVAKFEMRNKRAHERMLLRVTETYVSYSLHGLRITSSNHRRF